MKYRIVSSYKDINGITHYSVQSSWLGLFWTTHEYGGGTSVGECKKYIAQIKESASFENKVIHKE